SATVRRGGAGTRPRSAPEPREPRAPGGEGVSAARLGRRHCARAGTLRGLIPSGRSPSAGGTVVYTRGSEMAGLGTPRRQPTGAPPHLPLDSVTTDSAMFYLWRAALVSLRRERQSERPYYD